MVVYLPQEDKKSYEANTIIKTEDDGSRHIQKCADACADTESAEYLYLCLLFEDEMKLKKGDWYYSKLHSRIFQCIHSKQLFDAEREFKVIATNDTFITNTPRILRSDLRYIVENNLQ